jgi:hypothetical protein
MKPIGGDNSLFRRMNSLFGQQDSLFPEEQGIGCKPLNALGDRLPKLPREAGIGRNFQEFPVNFPAVREFGGKVDPARRRLFDLEAAR